MFHIYLVPDQILGVCVGISPAFVPSHLIPGPAYPKGNSLFGYQYLAYKQDQGSVASCQCILANDLLIKELECSIN